VLLAIGMNHKTGNTKINYLNYRQLNQKTMGNKTLGSMLTAFVEKNAELVKKAETISIAIFAIGFICHLLKIPNLDFIVIIGIIFTAIVFFLQAFRVIEFENYESYNSLGSIGFMNFIVKLYFFSLSVSMMSMLGFVIKIHNFSLYVCGGGTLIVVLILSLFSQMADKSKVYDLKFYLRLLVCLGLLAYLVMDQGVMK